jgi:hypothetical protein
MGMITVVWLVLLKTSDPAPTFMVVEEFKSQQQCKEELAAFIVKEHLDPKLARRLSCLTLTSSVVKDA